jgi:hypothetical protein
MRRVLFVKSGKHDDPVTRSTEVDEPTIRDLIATGGALRYLGTTVPALPAPGSATRNERLCGTGARRARVAGGWCCGGTERRRLLLVGDSASVQPMASKHVGRHRCGAPAHANRSG